MRGGGEGVEGGGGAVISRGPMTRAGLPATTTPGGTSLTTTARAPITLPSPMVTPGPMNASAAIHTPLPMVMVDRTSGRSGRW